MDKSHFRKSKILEEQNENIEIGPDGSIIRRNVNKTRTRFRPDEPDYIKLYIDRWQINEEGIPDFARMTFIQLALHMSYCNSQSLSESQLVSVKSPNKEIIMEACGIKNDQVWYRHLRALVDCDAIRPCYDANGKKKRGTYQINPLLVSRGAWTPVGRNPGYGVRDFVEAWESNTIQKQTMIYATDGTTYEGQSCFGLKEEEQMTITEVWDTEALPFGGDE